MRGRYILAIDQGTTSSRAVIFDKDCNPVDCVQREFPQHFPSPGLVEHDPEDIWESVRVTVAELLARNPDKPVAAIGITNQRETSIVWDAVSGKAVCDAIVWQDRRTSDFCGSLEGCEEMIRRKTGLLPDPYFSGTKIRWILENVPGARSAAEQGHLRFGTVDSFLVWRLTGGAVHATDVSNASRTMLFNIGDLSWDEDLLRLMDIPSSMLPEVRESSALYGYTHGVPGIPDGIPVTGVAGDQQASLFGQMCTGPGDVKCTYGTGCFLLMNCGDRMPLSDNRLLTTVAWSIGGKVEYALEGSVFSAGCVVQWLRDSLGIIRSSSEVEALASSVPDSGGVYFVPALTGLSAPYWRPDARASVSGISRGTTAAHLARAALEGIAYQAYDVMSAMSADALIPITALKVDGGASRNNLLMQFQADILGVPTVRPRTVETTALGAALLAGLHTGVWESVGSLRGKWREDRRFIPAMPAEEAETLLRGWHDAVARV